MAKSLKISKLAVARQTNLLMEIQPLDQLTKIINEEIVTDALKSCSAKLRKSFKTFFVITSILFLSMTKRKNFTQMALSSDCCESRFRQNFRKKFDWVGYNLAYCREKLQHRIAIAIDPSYIPKSGKHTPGTGYFWSGCASAAKWGLEILGIALVDADERDAYLDGGKKFFGFFQLLQHSFGPFVPLTDQGFQTCLAGGNECDFVHGKDAVQY